MALGPIWKVLRNKYYADELYGLVIAQKAGPEGQTGTVDSVRVQAGVLIRFVGWLSEFCAAIDRAIVDGTVNGVAAVSRGLSTVSGWIDKNIVDGTVNFVGMITEWLGDGLKLIQTGRVQNYLFVALTGATAFLVLWLFFIK